MHTIKLLLTYYLNISVQIAESNRKNRFGSESRVESNQNFFCPNWNALYVSRDVSSVCLAIARLHCAW